MPVLVFLLLDHLDPVVGDAHCETVVESHAAVLELSGESGHAAHLLGDGYGLGVHLVYEQVGERQVYQRVSVLVAVVVVVVRSERLTESVVVVEHRGDAVESEAVEFVLLEPELAVGEQEVKHAVLAVVEAERIPCRVLAARVAVEVEVVAAVEAAEALDFVLDGVRVHDVHDHGDAHRVRLVDELLELVGGAEARRCGVEVADVIAERAVVGVLLHGHELDGVVAVLGYARQHVAAELVVCPDALLVLGHSDVGLVDEQGIGVGRELADLEFIGMLGGVDLGREYLCVVVLHDAAGVCGQTVSLASGPEHAEFVEVAVM